MLFLQAFIRQYSIRKGVFFIKLYSDWPPLSDILNLIVTLHFSFILVSLSLSSHSLFTTSPSNNCNFVCSLLDPPLVFFPYHLLPYVSRINIFHIGSFSLFTVGGAIDISISCGVPVRYSINSHPFCYSDVRLFRCSSICLFCSNVMSFWCFDFCQEIFCRSNTVSGVRMNEQLVYQNYDFFYRVLKIFLSHLSLFKSS